MTVPKVQVCVCVHIYTHTKPESGLQHSSVLAAWIMFRKSAVGTHTLNLMHLFLQWLPGITPEQTQLHRQPPRAWAYIMLHSRARRGCCLSQGSPSKDIPLLSPKPASNKTFSYCCGSETSRMKLNYCLIIDNTSEFHPNFFFFLHHWTQFPRK